MICGQRCKGTKMTYTQVKEYINELGREGLEKLLKDYGEEVIKTAFECGVSPRELRAVGKWMENCIDRS